MLDILKAYQGINRCFTNAHPFTPLGGALHETASINPFALRYVQAPLHLGVNRAGNFWNRAVVSGAKDVHGIIGLNIAGEVSFTQILPTDFPCWGIGGGKLGSYNYDKTKAHPLQRGTLQVEICRGSKKDTEYYWAAIHVAERVYAMWARQYGFDPITMMDNGKTLQMTCHREAARAGFASNHGDPVSYMAWFGDTMDAFRKRVKAILDAPAEEVAYTYEHAMPTLYWKPAKRLNAVQVLQDCLGKLGYNVTADGYFGTETHDAVKAFREAHGIPTPVDRNGVQQSVSCDAATWAAINTALNGGAYVPTAHYTATANTALRVYTSARQTKSVGKIAEGSTVEITGALDIHYMAPCRFGAMTGYVDARGIINRHKLS